VLGTRRRRWGREGVVGRAADRAWRHGQSSEPEERGGCSAGEWE
jgi:hypothetical protein